MVSMPPLHWDINFPHICDAILNLALGDPDDATIRALRLTQRAIREFIDRRIVQHIECTVQSISLSTAAGHVRLPFEDERVAAQVRILDVCKGRGNTPRTWPAVSFPNLGHARLLAVGHRVVLDWLISDSSDVTLIVAISASLGDTAYLALRMHTSASVSRTITLVPAPKNRRPFSPEEANDLNALGGLVGLQPEELSIYSRGFMSCVTTVEDVADTGEGSDRAEYIQVRQGQKNSVQRIKDCVVAGQKDMTLARVIEVEHYGGPAWTFDRRYVSPAEWREGLSDEEWDLINSIPESIWTPQS